MKKSLYTCIVLMAAILFSHLSCDSPLKELNGITRAIISFHGFKNKKRVRNIKVIEVTGGKNLDIITKGILSSSTPLYKCGYDGEIKLYRGKEFLFDTKMNFNISCGRYIVYMKNGKLYSRELSLEFYSFLKHNAP